jgi:hypothetical protein
MKTLFAVLLMSAAITVPPELLSRIAETRSVGKRVAVELWPGWDPSATPFGAVERNQYIVVAGPATMPAPFVTYPAAEPVFVAPSATSLGNMKIALLAAEDMLAPKSIAEAVEVGIHALFRVHEQKIAPRKFADMQILLWGQYPDFSATNRVLLQMEATALHDGILATSEDEQRKHAAEFLGFRAERRKQMPPEIARYESAEESSEGLASYIEYRLLETAFPDRADLRKQRLTSLAYLSNLPREREQERFYLLGMAEALMLDRLRPGWKAEYESSDAFLDGLLEKVTTATPASKAWGNLLGEEQREQAKREAEGVERIRQMLLKGRKVVIEVAAVRALKDKIKLRALNPNLMVQLTPNHAVFSYLMLDLDEMHLEFAGQPVVYEKQQDAFWCMLPDDVVSKAIADMSDKLIIEGRGFKLQFENMEVSQRGKELRIHPSPVLEKQQQYKPEFVKPKPNIP